MTWTDPRDKEGKFTDIEGGNGSEAKKLSIAEILYGEKTKEERAKKRKKK